MSAPFVASILERRPLAPLHSPRQTFHLVLDLKGSNISYGVGDSVGIYADNNEEEVQEVLALVPGETTAVADRKGNVSSWGPFLRKKANLNTLNRKLVEIVAERGGNTPLKKLLEGDREGLKTYLSAFHLSDFLEEHREVKLTPEELAPLLMPLMPRFYSVASSQKVVGDEVHLLIGDVNYTLKGKERHGVASHQLCHVLPLNTPVVPLFYQKAHAFALTDDLRAPLIMIGPGTGVAPYRGFMQEQLLRQGTRKNWLFFGEWHENEHYFYRDEWESLEKKGWLKISKAFSRDQHHKVYVQHRMVEEGKELFQWIEEGGCLYVCGDASKMAKDVEDALLQVFREHGEMSEEAAFAYLKELRIKKRYQRDVY